MVRLGLALLLAAVTPVLAQETVARDHYINITSQVPASAGKTVKIYLRERATPAVMRKGAGDKVVLFVHGAGTPAEVAFDVPYQDYSWMGYLAKAGYDVFAVDMEGYGRSDRPAPMNDKCNLSPEQQKLFGVNCAQSYPGQLTSVGSDWNDISAAVDFIKQRRHVAKVNLIGWSQGGPRAGGWAAKHPDQVNRLVLLAPAYNRANKDTDATLPLPGATFSVQTHDDFIAGWNRQAPCPGQYDPRTADAIWAENLASDPVGATWTPASRRASNASYVPALTTAVLNGMTVPTLLFSGIHDVQVKTDRVRDFYADLGAKQKAFVALGCSSHNAMWEKNHLLLFAASLEWLDKGTVNGQVNTMQNMGGDE
jgi:pimeloyl-ACP methyl ester carboxylesterase